jgi:hypothetical protein
MKKVVRLNEKDIEKLIIKIIKEENSINEGPVDWVRSKFNQDEQLALLIYKGLKNVDAKSIVSDKEPKHGNRFSCDLDGHRIEVYASYHKSPEKIGKIIDLPRLKMFPFDHILKLDNEYLHVSESLKEKIWSLLKKMASEPEKKERFKNAKLLFSKYNLSDKERAKIDDTDSLFNNL